MFGKTMGGQFGGLAVGYQYATQNLCFALYLFPLVASCILHSSREQRSHTTGNNSFMKKKSPLQQIIQVLPQLSHKSRVITYIKDYPVQWKRDIIWLFIIPIIAFPALQRVTSCLAFHQISASSSTHSLMRLFSPTSHL